MHRQIAGSLTGRITKWVVLVAWLIVVGVSSTFAAKLADVQNNEASSWLPSSAESTRALEKLEPFQDPNAIPTIVVYERDSGLTQDDLAAAQEDAVELAGLDGVEGDVLGPFPSEDGVVAQTMVTFNLGSDGGTSCPTRPTRSVTSPTSTGSTPTSPAPVARPPMRPRHSAASTPRCSSPRSAW